MSSQIADVDAITREYAHIYLSPHLDDAVLSCGGAIALHIADDQQVLVVSICTGTPPSDSVFNALAQELHAAYGSDDATTAQDLRLREDAAAMEAIGADYLWLNQLDSIYRMPDAYVSDPAIFGPPAPGDPLGPRLTAFLAALYDRCPNATVYAPLGVGNHVDHQATYEAAAAFAEAGRSITFYEDLPYAARVSGSIDARIAVLGAYFISNVINIDATLARKLSAIDAYNSQVDRLFGGSDAMIASITEYAEGVRDGDHTYGERLWLRT